VSIRGAELDRNAARTLALATIVARSGSVCGAPPNEFFSELEQPRAGARGSEEQSRVNRVWSAAKRALIVATMLKSSYLCVLTF
jgi:hypothetical protein